jgi:hypothetical protein
MELTVLRYSILSGKIRVFKETHLVGFEDWYAFGQFYQTENGIYL